MKITVVITTWQVPFDQVVRGIRQFDDPETAKAFINKESKKWWDENAGERYVEEGYPETDKIKGEHPSSTEKPIPEPYKPITELGYEWARYEIWGGETGFHAILDAKSTAMLHEDHYKREYDDKGITRPGYLLNCYVAEGPEGEHVGSEAKHEEYVRQQTAGMKALTDYYDKKAQH